MPKQELLEYRDGLLEQVQTMAVERECAALRTLIEGTINADDPILSPGEIARETGWGDAAGSVSMPGDRQRGAYWPFFRTEMELAAIRAIGRRIAEADAMGGGVVRNLINYTVGTGFSYQVQEKRRGTVLPGDLAAVQTALDAFLAANQIPAIRERKLMEEALPAGEALVVLKDHPDGIPRVRIRSTDHLIQPVRPRDIEEHYGLEPGLDWSFGVAAPPDDVEDVRGYCVAWYGVLDNWEFLPVDRCLHVKLNTPDDVKRGLSEFYADYREILRAGKGFMTASDQAILQATIAWIEKIDKGTPEAAVQSATSTPATFVASLHGRNGTRPVRFEQFAAGRVIRTDHDFAYGPMGDPKGFELIQVFQAVARRVGARRSMPEWMISGDASNNNMSSSVTAGSGFDVAMQCLQMGWCSEWEQVCWMALAIMGFDTVALKRKLRLSVTGRQIASRDEAVDENIRETRFRNGILSAKTWAADANLDLEEELANGAKQQQPPPAPGGGMFSALGLPRMEQVEQVEARTQSLAIRAIDMLLERQTEDKWITVNGSPVKIEDGQSEEEAIAARFGDKHDREKKYSGTEEIMVGRQEIKAYINPSLGQLQGYFNRHKEVRGILDPNTGDITYWPAAQATHYEMGAVLGIEVTEDSPKPYFRDPKRVEKNWTIMQSLAKQAKGKTKMAVESITREAIESLRDPGSPSNKTEANRGDTGSDSSGG